MAAYTDNFTRSNGALGANWSNGNGSDPQIVSNQAAMGGTTDGYYPSRWASPAATDRWMVSVTYGATPSGTLSGALIRANSGWTQQVITGASNANTYIYTATAASGGTETQRATVATGFASGDTLKIVALGNLYTVYKNGTSILTWTDSGGVVGTGSANRNGGIWLQRASFVNSSPISLWTMSDLVLGSNPCNAAVWRPNNY